MHTIRFSIAMPVGAWHDLFPKAMQSIADQNADVQVALLDASGDPRVREAADASGLDFAWRRHGPDDGQAAAIAEGWRNTDAEIVSWLNADDLLAPGALALAAQEFAADPAPDVFYGGSEFIDAAGRVTGVHDHVADAGPRLLRSNVISQPSCFVRRRAMEAAGALNERLHYTMDWDLWIRLYRNGARFKRTDRILSQVYMGSGTKTLSLDPRRYREIGALAARHAGPWMGVRTTAAAALSSLMQTLRAS